MTYNNTGGFEFDALGLLDIDVPIQQTTTTAWTSEENKEFERALVTYPEGFPHRWDLILTHLPGKTVDNLKDHYADLIFDLNNIESDLIELPHYPEDSFYTNNSSRVEEPLDVSQNPNLYPTNSVVEEQPLNVYYDTTPQKTKRKNSNNSWTEEEHRRFLMGLERYGKGDWRSISREALGSTKTSTQVASHAQKYFIRQESIKKKGRKRSSIHDITLSSSDSNIIVPAVPLGPPPINFSAQQEQGSYQNYNNNPTSYSNNNLLLMPPTDTIDPTVQLNPPLMNFSMQQEPEQKQEQRGYQNYNNDPTFYSNNNLLLMSPTDTIDPTVQLNPPPMNFSVQQDQEQGGYQNYNEILTSYSNNTLLLTSPTYETIFPTVPLNPPPISSIHFSMQQDPKQEQGGYQDYNSISTSYSDNTLFLPEPTSETIIPAVAQTPQSTPLINFSMQQEQGGYENYNNIPTV